jgi:CBS domain-containing protein
MRHPLLCLPAHTSIQKAIQLIERSPFDSAFIVDGRGAYQGCVSMAELRRLLVSGARGEETVGAYPPKHAYKLAEESLGDRKTADRMISDMELYGAHFLPVVGADGSIAEVLSLEDLVRLHGISRTDCRSAEPARRVLVVGGAGFLGSVLTQKLLQRGFRVRVLDSFIYGRRSLDSCSESKNLEIVEGDLRNIHTCVSSLAETDAVEGPSDGDDRNQCAGGPGSGVRVQTASHQPLSVCLDLQRIRNGREPARRGGAA